jgi:hypothetical protein
MVGKGVGIKSKMGKPSRFPIRAPGFKFGHWEVIHEVIIREPKWRRYYLCRCLLCGLEKLTDQRNLERGKTSSCVPCANKIMRAREGSVFDLYAEYASRELIQRLSHRYYAAISRCRGKGYGSHRYGGRGITVEFSSVHEYVGYALTLPNCEVPHLDIDRIDNNGSYRRGNLHFITHKENNRNKDNLTFIEWDGRRMCAAEFWETYCPRYRCAHTVGRKIHEGLTAQEIIHDQVKCKGPYKKAKKAKGKA